MLSDGRMNSRFAHMRQQRDQRLPEAVDVGEQDRLGVTAELLPGHLLDQFLQRADAAGKGDERIGVLEHQPFALVHVGRDDHLLHSCQHISRDRRKSGMMPVTAPPWSSVDLAIAPIRPTEPPP